MITKLGIKLGKLRIECHCHPISIHRLESCNNTQRRVSTIDRFFIWENFIHIKNTILTNVFVGNQT